MFCDGADSDGADFDGVDFVNAGSDPVDLQNSDLDEPMDSDSADFDDADSLARVLDREIVGGLATFPTFLEADALEKGELGGQLVGRVKTSFESALKKLPQDYQQHFLLQYANQLRNKQKNFETD